ncbi:MAG: NTP transferase domain-containing protein [Acidimicrobiales bacterium]
MPPSEPDPSGGGPAGLLLTGGSSRRLGRDKASLPVGPGGLSLAGHLGAMLELVAGHCFEIGPGVSSLERASEPDPRKGPLAAIAVGARALRAVGWSGPVLVVATDLPRLSFELLSAIASWPVPADRSVVPVSQGCPQPLCARWAPGAVARAVQLSARGERRVQTALGEGLERVLLKGEDLPGIDLDAELADIDDEAALRQAGLGWVLEDPLLPDS